MSDRAMRLKLEIEGVMFHVVSGYVPQPGCEKERFWSVIQSTHRSERVPIGADFNGHVRAGCRGDEESFGHVWYR